jgi:hypothetical protein
MATTVIRATRGEDGLIRVDGFPPRILMTSTFLDHVDPSFVRREGEEIVFTAANGSARYRFTEPAAQRDPWDIWEAERIDGGELS